VPEKQGDGAKAVKPFLGTRVLKVTCALELQDHKSSNKNNFSIRDVQVHGVSNTFNHILEPRVRLR